MIADIDMVADELGKSVSQSDVADYLMMQRLVAISRRYGGDAGMSYLAGKWAGQGMPEHEIIARCWPQSTTRLTVVR